MWCVTMRWRAVLLSTFIVYLSAISFAAVAQARGGMEGGGGDLASVQTGSAWFLGERSIRVCYVLDPDFAPGSKGLDVAHTLTSVFKTWDAYVAKRGANTDTQAGFGLDTHFILKSSCEGSEDLRIYFGGTNAEIARAQVRYSNPVAFANRTQYSLADGWGKGFIWVAPSASVAPGEKFPNWGDLESLNGILLHEIGHVLGCDHVDGTIMDANIAESLLARELDPAARHARFTQIDGASFLAASGGEFVGNPSDSATFQILMGRLPIGKASLTLKISNALSSFIISLGDSQGTSNFNISLPLLGPAPLGALLGSQHLGSIFRQARKINGSEVAKWGDATSLVASGTLASLSGDVYPVQLFLNMHAPSASPAPPAVDGPVLVRLIDKSGTWRNLFTMPWVGLTPSITGSP